ncbi:4-hydroxybenzoate octaprenyltransferase [Thermococcus waiotapuensis]|uniref:4-hydroxybenzoate octaprenyltransferase n=1 Tax=Thermococcus waiotapuensis TaxID=90909 RepID=A0AAE4T2A1_9EURY|nr:4-hydroxybenzoate octaprenyltransferase [Thermococcus waiotapuensis]MDV3103897.1 4-hydroxybenzoate octaprenyltransferase [Thermococcus waiotapuensis]
MVFDPGEVSKANRFHALMRLVRIEHTLFSLPYAYVGALLSGFQVTLAEIILMSLALLGLRTAALAYNNIADIDIDSLNPRTWNRPLIKGTVKISDAWWLVVVGSVLYFVSAVLLNFWTALLSPIPWILALSYPQGKRKHSFPHLHLGLTLAMAVTGGTIASGGDEANLLVLLENVPWAFFFGVLFWVAGFDTIYALMDYEFDVKHGVGSIPARFGIKRGLDIALTFHLIAIALFGLAGPLYGLGGVYQLGWAVGSFLILYENYLSRKGLENVPKAFNLNIPIGLVLTLSAIVDALLKLGGG